MLQHLLKLRAGRPTGDNEGAGQRRSQTVAWERAERHTNHSELASPWDCEMGQAKSEEGSGIYRFHGNVGP